MTDFAEIEAAVDAQADGEPAVARKELGKYAVRDQVAVLATHGAGGGTTLPAAWIVAANELDVVAENPGDSVAVECTSTAGGFSGFNARNQTVFSNAAITSNGQLALNPDGTVPPIAIYEALAPFSQLMMLTLAGIPIFGGHAAPADGDVPTSGFALWLDDTNGAAKLMVKAKQADGTVVTGSLALVA